MTLCQYYIYMTICHTMTLCLIPYDTMSLSKQLYTFNN